MERERFTASELAMVLSRYDLGVIESAKEFARGSRKSPKLLLRTAQGRYLLKRRAVGREQVSKVAFAHALSWHLCNRGFPVPRLALTRDGNETFVNVPSGVYELFEFVEGERYDQSLEQTSHAGRMLARFHRAVADLQSAWQPPTRSYHNSEAVRNGLNSIPTTVSAHESVFGHEAELLGLTQHLYERYEDAVEAADHCGLPQQRLWHIHGDWHPGNMLFKGGRVSVVLDFDSVRRAPVVVDLANGLLQFSILRGGGAPEAWPAFFDEARMRRFFGGYTSSAILPIEQRRALIPLMIESLIAEAVVPIAATGSFGPIPGFGVLQMVRRKVLWIDDNRERIERWMYE